MDKSLHQSSLTIRLSIPLCILWAVLLFVGCGSSSIAGNGTETGNPKIIGFASEKSGKPAAHVGVTVCRSTYSPFGSKQLAQTVTNSDGRFEVEVPDTGSYSIILMKSDSSMGIFSSVQVDDQGSVELAPLTLEQTKTVILYRPSTELSHTWYAEGTPFTVTFAAGDDSTQFTHVPVGAYTFIDSASLKTTGSIVVQASDPAVIDLHTKPTILAIAPTGWDSASSAVSQLLLCEDTSSYRLTIADSREAETLLSGREQINGVVILQGSEQQSELVQILDTIAIPILVSSAEWLYSLHMVDETGFGMTDVKSVLLNGLKSKQHPITAPLGITEIVSYDVVDSSVLLCWGKPTSAALVLAYGVLDQSQNFIFIYETDDIIYGKKAPARRVAVPFGNGILTDTSRTIYRTALQWFISEVPNP